ncbi:hypothetical protein [Xanthomonas axonopodis]|uniref:hypothetical protein n=1 Tax=Xanthomonas axonopodis TaxID=53413 RepID=UPI0035593122
MSWRDEPGLPRDFFNACVGGAVIFGAIAALAATGWFAVWLLGPGYFRWIGITSRELADATIAGLAVVGLLSVAALVGVFAALSFAGMMFREFWTWIRKP